MRRLRDQRREARRSTEARRKAAKGRVLYNPAWEKDPVLFAKEALGLICWRRQAELLRAVASHGRVAVKSGHKVGKSTSAVILALWRVCTRKRARVIMTSSSGRQVKAILWKELRRVYHAAPYDIGGTLHRVPDAGLQFDDGREIIGFSTQEPEKMAGFSGPDILFIVDEASGVEEAIFEAIEGNRAGDSDEDGGGADVVLFSNPTRTSGTFFDAFHSKRDLWHTLTISSEESPNVEAGRTVIPGLAGLKWITEKLQDWGRDSSLYQVRVLGNFPQQGSNVVVPLALVEASQRLWVDPEAPPEIDIDGEEIEAEPLDDTRLELGVDPARFGDDESVIAPRRGRHIYHLRAFQGIDGVELAREVVRVIRALRREGDPLPRVKVDSVGLGASCADQLRHHRGPDGEPELELIEVNSAARATTDDHHRLRDQLWFAVTDWLSEGGLLPPDDKLARDLIAPTYGFDAQNKLLVEPKKITKKRLGHSPDRADAVALSIWRGEPETTIPEDDGLDALLPTTTF